MALSFRKANRRHSKRQSHPEGKVNLAKRISFAFVLICVPAKTFCEQGWTQMDADGKSLQRAVGAIGVPQPLQLRRNWENYAALGAHAGIAILEDRSMEA